MIAPTHGIGENREIIHKGETGRYYNGIPIHAAEGVHESVAEELRSRFPKGVTVLELGAGSGALTERLIDLGFTVTPLDLDDATWQNRRSKLVVADLNGDEWENSLDAQQYDAVIAIEVIEHLQNPRRFVETLFRLTSNNGICVITTPNVLCARSTILMLTKGTFHLFSQRDYFRTGHISILPHWLLETMGKEVGFSIESTSFTGELGATGPRLLVMWMFSLILRLLRGNAFHLKGLEMNGNTLIVFRKSPDMDHQTRPSVRNIRSSAK